MVKWLKPRPSSLLSVFSNCVTMSAWVAELVDARDLKSLGACPRAGSSPALGTSNIRGYLDFTENMGAYLVA